MTRQCSMGRILLIVALFLAGCLEAPKASLVDDTGEQASRTATPAQEVQDLATLTAALDALGERVSALEIENTELKAKIADAVALASIAAATAEVLEVAPAPVAITRTAFSVYDGVNQKRFPVVLSVERDGNSEYAVVQFDDGLLGYVVLSNDTQDVTDEPINAVAAWTGNIGPVYWSNANCTGTAYAAVWNNTKIRTGVVYSGPNSLNEVSAFTFESAPTILTNIQVNSAFPSWDQPCLANTETLAKAIAIDEFLDPTPYEYNYPSFLFDPQ